MKMGLSSMFVFLVVLAILMLASCSEKSYYDSFAKCLTSKNITMYGTEWCTHCQNQKKMFGQSFQYVDFVDCDKNSGLCNEKGIEGYPTWIINSQKYTGDSTLSELAVQSGCVLKRED